MNVYWYFVYSILGWILTFIFLCFVQNCSGSTLFLMLRLYNNRIDSPAGNFYQVNNTIRIGIAIWSIAIWKTVRTSEFFKGYENSTNPKDECYLRSLKNSQVRAFSKLHEKSCYYHLMIYIKKVIQCREKVIQCKLLYLETAFLFANQNREIFSWILLTI